MMKKLFLLCFLTVVFTGGAMAQESGVFSERILGVQYCAYLYSSSKLLSDEEDYVVYEDSFSEPIEGSTFCQSTGKLYLLEGSRTIVEYDIDAVKRKKGAKRVINLSFNVERKRVNEIIYIGPDPRTNTNEYAKPQANAIVEVSPDGKYLALVDENHKNLHVIDIFSGDEARLVKLGKKFDNYRKILFESKYEPAGCPFAFQSNDEILVAGQNKILLYNIKSDRKKYISYPKYHLYEGEEKHTQCVTPDGYVFWIGGVVEYLLKYHEGGIDLKSVWEFTNVMCFDENEVIWGRDDRTIYRDRRTGKQLIHHWADSKNQYVFRNFDWDVHDNKEVLFPAIRAVNNDGIYLVFPMNDTIWKASFLTGPIGEGYFYIYGDKKLRIFNQNLTSNEIEKAIMRYIIKKNDLDRLNKFISDYPNSIYKEFAQQNIDRIITEKWESVSKPSNYTLDHFKEVEQFISEYASYGNMQEARDELANIYKGAYESLGDNDRRGIDQYIINYPKSPYIDQAKQKQRQLYAPGYEAVCKENSLYQYRDYVRTYPNSPYRYEVERRIRGIEEREREEALAEQRRKEAAALAEQQRKEAAALAEKQRQEEAALAEKKRKEAAALAEKQRQEAEKKRKEEERIAEQKRKEAERERQIAANSKVSTWKLGNKICNCQKNHVMVILDSWNENKTSFKGQILTSDVSKFEGQLMKKGSTVWFDTKGWHKCLEDEIEYCTKHDVSSSSDPAITSSTTKVGPPLTKGTEVHRRWTYKYKSWALASEREGTRVVTGVIEEWNEDYTMAKIKITYLYDSEHSNPYYLYDNVSTDKYYLGETYWVGKGWWK